MTLTMHRKSENPSTCVNPSAPRGQGIDSTNLDGSLVPSDIVEARRRRGADYPEYEMCEEGEEPELDADDPDAPTCKTATQLALMVRGDDTCEVFGGFVCICRMNVSCLGHEEAVMDADVSTYTAIIPTVYNRLLSTGAKAPVRAPGAGDDGVGEAGAGQADVHRAARRGSVHTDDSRRT